MTSLLFFGSILAHEMGHSVVAKRYGIRVAGITLFVFGGVARITTEPRRPGIEAAIALAGPLVSAALGGVSLGLSSLTRDSNESLGALFLYLGRANLLVAVFNMIPGFPLDGGRVLRAAMWKLRGDYTWATKGASFVGQAVGLLFIAGGVAAGIVTRDLFDGLWFVVIGWFLHSAASQGYAQAGFRERLRGVPVSDLMSSDVPMIPRRIDLRTLVEGPIAYTGRQCFLVGEDGQWEGLLSLEDILKVPRPQWAETRAGDVMTPASSVRSLRPDDDALRALEMMDEAEIAHLPVRVGREVVGLLGREAVTAHIAPRRKARQRL